MCFSCMRIFWGYFEQICPVHHNYFKRTMMRSGGGKAKKKKKSIAKLRCSFCGEVFQRLKPRLSCSASQKSWRSSLAVFSRGRTSGKGVPSPASMAPAAALQGSKGTWLNTESVQVVTLLQSSAGDLQHQPRQSRAEQVSCGWQGQFAHQSLFYSVTETSCTLIMYTMNQSTLSH